MTTLPATDESTATILIDDVTSDERLLRVGREFVENAAHELRTPITAIAGALDLLKSGTADDPETRDRFIAHVASQSERLSRLVETMLALARIQMGQEQPHLELVPVKPLLEEVTAIVESSPEVPLEVEAADDVAVLADPELLRQSLVNVVKNAIRHTHRGQIVLEGHTLGRTAAIEIRDSGSGMTTANTTQAFERFYRGDGASGDGVGLGLAIAYEAITALGGTIELASADGDGTLVRIMLPSARLIRS